MKTFSFFLVLYICLYISNHVFLGPTPESSPFIYLYFFSATFSLQNQNQQPMHKTRCFFFSNNCLTSKILLITKRKTFHCYFKENYIFGQISSVKYSHFIRNLQNCKLCMKIFRFLRFCLFKRGVVPVYVMHFLSIWSLVDLEDTFLFIPGVLIHFFVHQIFMRGGKGVCMGFVSYSSLILINILFTYYTYFTNYNTIYIWTLKKTMNVDREKVEQTVWKMDNVMSENNQ